LLHKNKYYQTNTKPIENSVANCSYQYHIWSTYIFHSVLLLHVTAFKGYSELMISLNVNTMNLKISGMTATFMIRLVCPCRKSALQFEEQTLLLIVVTYMSPGFRITCTCTCSFCDLQNTFHYHGYFKKHEDYVNIIMAHSMLSHR
jgi:hypothetical protein